MSDATSKSNGENEKLSSAMNEIFSNPQILAAISSMAQNLKNGETASTTSQPEEPKPKEEEEKANEVTASITNKLPELLNMLSSNSNASNIKRSHKSELLCALKPYLSQNRSDAIDKIIRFSELSSVFKNLS